MNSIEIKVIFFEDRTNIDSVYGDIYKFDKNLISSFSEIIKNQIEEIEDNIINKESTLEELQNTLFYMYCSKEWKELLLEYINIYNLNYIIEETFFKNLKSNQKIYENFRHFSVEKQEYFKKCIGINNINILKKLEHPKFMKMQKKIVHFTNMLIIADFNEIKMLKSEIMIILCEFQYEIASIEQLLELYEIKEEQVKHLTLEVIENTEKDVEDQMKICKAFKNNRGPIQVLTIN